MTYTNSFLGLQLDFPSSWNFTDVKWDKIKQTGPEDIDAITITRNSSAEDPYHLEWEFMIENISDKVDPEIYTQDEFNQAQYPGMGGSPNCVKATDCAVVTEMLPYKVLGYPAVIRRVYQPATGKTVYAFVAVGNVNVDSKGKALFIEQPKYFITYLPNPTYGLFTNETLKTMNDITKSLTKI
jgi:hypothetical protein